MPGLLSGSPGEQLPGSPKNSVSAALIYDISLAPGSVLSLSANGAYRSASALQVAPSLGNTTMQHSSTYQIMNFSAALTHRPWRATLYRDQRVRQAGDPGATFAAQPGRQPDQRLSWSIHRARSACASAILSDKRRAPWRVGERRSCADTQVGNGTECARERVDQRPAGGCDSDASDRRSCRKSGVAPVRRSRSGTPTCSSGFRWLHRSSRRRSNRRCSRRYAPGSRTSSS